MSRFQSKPNIKRVIALLLALVCLIAVCVIPASAEGGTCGAGLSWSYSAGTLVITGEGEMYAFNERDPAPWHHLRADIKRVIFPEGLASIGGFAFYGCTNLQGIDIPDDVRTIGSGAFFGCENLRLAKLPAKLSRIGNQAFYGCTSLAAVQFPIGVESIGDKAFYLCESLITVTVPRYAEKLGAQVFAYCTSLIRVQIESNIRTVPEWMFYGCYNLIEISLPSTVTSVDFYAFKNCDSLTCIYHTGDSGAINAIRTDIAESNPVFAESGFIGNGTLSDTSVSVDEVYDTSNNLVSQTDTTVKVEENVTVITQVETTPGTSSTHTTYSSSVTVVVGENASWDEVADAVGDALRDINNQNSLTGASTGTTITVYTDDASSVGEELLKEIAGRDIDVEIVNPSGNTWRVDGTAIKQEEISGPADYSYVVGAAPAESTEKLGTDDCYSVEFSQSTSLNSEILIQLPDSAVGKNAFLYQVEEDGSYTKLQAVAVDNDANAHFFLSNVEQETQYIVGLNVPGESTDDIIIPKELSDVYGAIQRLEKIEYVSTGVRNINGLTLGNLLLMVLGLLVLISIVIGAFMYYKNRQKLLKNKKAYAKR